MNVTLNRNVQAVATPPIADVQGWISGRSFPPAKPLLDVSQAVPSYPPAGEMIAHLAGALRRADTSLYTDILGIEALRAALAKHLSDDYAGRVAAEQIAITAGCNQAFCIAVDALAAAGDEVLLPVPYYFNHQMWLEMRGIAPVHVPFREREAPRPADIAERITARTRAVVLVSPNNPTGEEYPPELIVELFELAKKHGIALIIDETYKDFRVREGPAHPLFARDDWAQCFVHLFSFSKAYAMTGFRVGAIAAHQRLTAEAEKLLDCVSICPSHVGQLGALYGLEHLAGWKGEKVRMMQERVIALREAFNSHNRLRYQLVSSGAYFAYVRHPFEGESATAVARRLADEANILCLPGNMFGPEQERYLRFAFANLAVERIPELVARLADAS